MIEHPHVEIVDNVPTVKGSRVAVAHLWRLHQSGAMFASLFKRYHTLGPAKILDALSFAYDNQDLMEG